MNNVWQKCLAQPFIEVNVYIYMCVCVCVHHLHATARSHRTLWRFSHFFSVSIAIITREIMTPAFAYIVNIKHFETELFE